MLIIHIEMFYKWNMTFLLDTLALWRCKVLPLLLAKLVCGIFLVRVWFGFSCSWISLANQFPYVSLCFVTASLTCVMCGERRRIFKFFLSAILMRLSSNIDRRIARAIYKQSAIVVFDKWTNGGLYVHIAGVRSGSRLALWMQEKM